MRTKKGFKLREVCGEKILLAEGVENIDFSDIISMNASSAYLWEQVDGKDFTVEEMARLLTEQYEVEETVALEDAKEIERVFVEPIRNGSFNCEGLPEGEPI